MQDFRGAEFLTDGCEIRLKSVDWPGPVHLQAFSPDHHLHLNLPPVTYRGELLFPDLPHPRRCVIGRAYFRPADLRTETWGTGGRSFSVDCMITRERARQMIGEDLTLSPAQVERGTDLDLSPVLPLLNRIAQELRMPSMGHPAMIEALANQALIELVRFLGGSAAESHETGRLSVLQMRRIEERMAAEELSPPTVAELAQLCAVSERHLLRLFQATTGSSVSGYIRRELMSRARHLLEEGRPIKQIAHTLGFSGPSSFSLAFRNATGCTPAAFREDRQRRRQEA